MCFIMNKMNRNLFYDISDAISLYLIYATDKEWRYQQRNIFTILLQQTGFIEHLDTKTIGRMLETIQKS